MKVYRYSSGRFASVFALVVALGICVALIANDLGIAVARGSEGFPLSILLVPLISALGWAVFASRWVCRVEVEGSEMRVVNLFGKAKKINLKEPYQFRTRDGESALVIEVTQGDVMVRIHEFIDGFSELKEMLRSHGRS